MGKGEILAVMGCLRERVFKSRTKFTLEKSCYTKTRWQFASSCSTLKHSELSGRQRDILQGKCPLTSPNLDTKFMLRKRPFLTSVFSENVKKEVSSGKATPVLHTRRLDIFEDTTLMRERDLELDLMWDITFVG